jgi:uncharacterized OsmC-like protein
VVEGIWRGGKSFHINLGGGRALTVDADGPRSTDLLLAGLVACSGRSFCDILQKMRLLVRNVTLRVEADKEPDPPNTFTEIRVYWTVDCGAAPPDKVHRALDLTEQYCTVLNILKKAAPVKVTREFRADTENLRGRSDVGSSVEAEEVEM